MSSVCLLLLCCRHAVHQNMFIKSWLWDICFLLPHICFCSVFLFLKKSPLLYCGLYTLPSAVTETTKCVFLPPTPQMLPPHSGLILSLITETTTSDSLTFSPAVLFRMCWLSLHRTEPWPSIIQPVRWSMWLWGTRFPPFPTLKHSHSLSLLTVNICKCWFRIQIWSFKGIK